MEATAALRPFSAPGAPASAGRAGWRCAHARRRLSSVAARLEGGLGKGVPTTNYVVPLDKPTGMTRPLVEILRDLNKRVPDKIIDPQTNTVPWSVIRSPIAVLILLSARIAVSYQSIVGRIGA
jgi:hypothetical protein